MIEQSQNYEPASIFDNGNNAFDAIRLFAALIVIYSHSYTIAPVPGSAELVASVTGVTHAGELSVVIFFFLSGALITKSLLNTKSDIVSYFKKRILRIYPALIVSSFLSAYFFSWMFGGQDFDQIIASKDSYYYFIKNSIGVWNVHEIPGVYENHPSKALNGSLWSITLELRLYLVLGLLYISGMIKNEKSLVVVFFLIILAIVISPESVPLIGSDHASFGNYAFPVFSCIFLAGGLFYVLEKHFKISIGTIVINSLILALCFGSNSTKFLIFFLTIVLSIWIATRPIVVRHFKIKNDYSYGVYLFGWPSQQIAYSLVAVYSTPHPWQITLVAIPIAVFLAHFSWVYIERACINLGKKNIQYGKR